MLDLGKAKFFSLKRLVEHLNKYKMTFGDNYTAVTIKVTRGNKSYDCTFVYFVKPVDVMIGCWALGAMGSRASFLTQLCGAPMFMDMFQVDFLGMNLLYECITCVLCVVSHPVYLYFTFSIIFKVMHILPGYFR